MLMSVFIVKLHYSMLAGHFCCFHFLQQQQTKKNRQKQNASISCQKISTEVHR